MKGFGRKPARAAYIHVGTHKTGTTALQIWLARNASTLAKRGVYVPRSGRPATLFRTTATGHHNIAWQLLGDRRYDPGDGSLDELANEIASTHAKTIVITSEDFGVLFDRRESLATLREVFSAAGFDPSVVLYLRPQRGYLHALYAELVRQGALLDFESFLESVVRDGAFTISGYTFSFDYAPLLDAFVACFGERSVLVRPYQPAADAQHLPQDFLSTIGARGDSRLVAAGTQNAGATYGDLLRTLHQAFRRRAGSLPWPQDLAHACGIDPAVLFATPFTPIDVGMDGQVTQRFGASNEAIEKRFGFRFAADPPAREQWAERALLRCAFERWSRLPPSETG